MSTGVERLPASKTQPFEDMGLAGYDTPLIDARGFMVTTPGMINFTTLTGTTVTNLPVLSGVIYPIRITSIQSSDTGSIWIGY
jgi:hypothetical protein